MPGVPISASYLAYALEATDLNVTANLAVKGSTLNLSSLRALNVAVPPLCEQRRIVDLMSAADRALSAARQTLGQALVVRVQLLQDYFGRLAGVDSSSELIHTTVGAVADVVGGGTPSTSVAENWGGDIAWLTPTEVAKAEGCTISKSKRTITSKGLSSSGARLLPSGSVLLTSRATIGSAALVGAPLATNQGFQSLIPRDGVLAGYLLCWAMTNKALLVNRASGTTFLEISKQTLKSLPITIPPIVEQRRIADLTEAATGNILAATNRHSALSTLRNNLLHDLMSGAHRIPASYDRVLDEQAEPAP
jgi:type I restriction enzyme S subunit